MTDAEMRARNQDHVARARALATQQGISYEQALREVASSILESERPPVPARVDREVLNFRGFDDAALEQAYIDADIGSPQYGAIRGELRRRLRAGNGAELDNLEGAGGDFAMEPELTPIGARVPGPVGYGTGRSEPGAPIYSEEEMAAYEMRQPAGDEKARAAVQLTGGGPYRGGDFLPSQEDEDMYARGMIYNINPVTGEGGYSVAYPQLPEMGTPGAPGRLGPRADLRGPVRDTATGGYIQGSSKYEKQLADSPLGQVEVYRPTNEFRKELAAREKRMRIERLGKRAGLTNDEILSMTSGESPADLDNLRTLGNLRRADDLADRKAEVVRRAQERYNPTAQMNDDWRQFALAVRTLGPKAAGASPSDVELARAQADAAMQARMGVGRDMRPESPELKDAQLRALEDKRRQENPVGVGTEDLAAGRLHTPEAQRVIDEMAEEADTGGGGLWWAPGYGAMSAAAEATLAARLRDRFGLSEQEAAYRAREAANKRRRGPLGGDWGMLPTLPRPQ